MELLLLVGGFIGLSMMMNSDRDSAESDAAPDSGPVAAPAATIPVPVETAPEVDTVETLSRALWWRVRPGGPLMWHQSCPRLFCLRLLFRHPFCPMRRFLAPPRQTGLTVAWGPM